MTYAVLVYEIRADSLEYLPVLVKASKDGESYDPTVDLVAIALPAIDGGTATYHSAAWQTITTDDKPSYYARILVGPGSVFPLDAGDYDILIKITDSPEIPVLRAGLLRVT